MECQFLRKSCILVFIMCTLALVSGNLEDDYVKHFGNDAENKKGLWKEALEMEKNGTLELYCSRVHFLDGRTSYENIDEAQTIDGTLRFINQGSVNKPMKIIVVKYKSDREKEYFYLTKGMNDDCLFCLDPVGDESNNEFHLTRHLCDCTFF